METTVQKKLVGRCILGSIQLLEQPIKNQLQIAKALCDDQRKLFDLPPAVTMQNCVSAMVVRFAALQLAQNGDNILNKADMFTESSADKAAVAEAIAYWQDVKNLIITSYSRCEECFINRYGMAIC